MVITARRKEALEKVAEEIAAAGGTVLAVPTDISKSEDSEKLMELVIEKFGKIDILVNNAGILTFAYIFLNMCCSSLLYPILELRIPRILRHGNRRYHDYTKKEKLERM